MNSLSIWYDHKRDCYSSNAAMLLGKRLGVTPCEAAALLAIRSAADLHAAGVEEISFTLAGQTEPVWTVRL